MELVVAAVLLLTLAAPLALATAWFVSHGGTAIAQLFMPPRPMGWPHGVQEDDDFQWHWPGRVPPPPAPRPTSGVRDGHDGGAGSEPTIEAAVLEELPPGNGTLAGPVRRDG